MTFTSFIQRLTITLLLIGSLILIFINKGDVVLAINGQHTPFLDQFFSLATNLGDGLIFAIITILLLFWRFKYAILCASIGVLHLVLVAFLKRIVFHDMVRPRNFFNHVSLHFVPWVDVHGQMSFPSGHTTSIFAIALFIALISQRKHIACTLFAIAIIVACSRMYLLQHFYMDVFAGMALGLFCTSIVWYQFTKINLPPWAESRLVVNVKVSRRKAKISRASA